MTIESDRLSDPSKGVFGLKRLLAQLALEIYILTDAAYSR